MSDLSKTGLIITVGANPPQRLDKALATHAPEASALSRSRLVRLIEGGQVRRLGGDVVTALKTKAVAGEQWVVAMPPTDDINARPENIPLDVLFEDDDVIVVNKAAGMVVHPAPGSPNGTLVNALLHHCGDLLSGFGGRARPGIVHRIDKDTSGVLVVAKSDLAHQRLAGQFADHSIERHYRAVVYGVPSRGDPRLAGLSGVAFEPGNITRISGNIARHKTDRKRMTVVRDAGRHAITRCKVMQEFGAGTAALLDCWLETGRTHQIRVHLSHVGHPLIGDQTYGHKRRIKAGALGESGQAAVAVFPRQALHAASLGFVHPRSGRALRFSAELPEDMAALVTQLSE